jgi:hypothetical protein
MKLLFKILLILNLFDSSSAHSQNFISFRNCLNEGNYWFYEQEYDSAYFYYHKAEDYRIKFFAEETHLYSRTLWEIGHEKKSIQVLSKGGFSEFFKNDTTFYIGLPLLERKKILNKLPSIEEGFLYKNMSFYDQLDEQDQRYRKEIKNLNEKKGQIFDSLVGLLKSQDSINFILFIEEIKKNGYPGGYTYAGTTPGLVLLHVDPILLLRNYKLFYTEIEKGRMNLYDFTRAYDRCLITPDNQNHKPYNVYFSLDSTSVDSPEMVFINRCLIGMSPYYDVHDPKVLPKGKIPFNKSMLYEYYKKRKQNFNCIQIK